MQLVLCWGLQEQSTTALSSMVDITLGRVSYQFYWALLLWLGFYRVILAINVTHNRQYKIPYTYIHVQLCAYEQLQDLLSPCPIATKKFVQFSVECQLQKKTTITCQSRYIYIHHWQGWTSFIPHRNSSPSLQQSTYPPLSTPPPSPLLYPKGKKKLNMRAHYAFVGMESEMR